ncbi:DUF1080 domain-containing protein [candidate division KSB1 bacterium]|nr:DUF1080 domain-containing protein [candidate division KSB1 bacterium]
MRPHSVLIIVLAFMVMGMGCENSQSQESEWISLFDGKSLDGWKASENKDTFSVQDGKIKVHGKRSHLFYVGEVENADFKNFELKAEVMTEPGANSGIYIHTEYQEEGWPKKGYEVQVNNSHSDWKRTSSIYDVVNIKEAPAKDNEWFTQHIIVKGNQVTVMTDGKTIVEYTEPEDVNFEGWPGRRLSHGTIALQGHDPKSVVYYKNIKIKPLD